MGDTISEGFGAAGPSDPVEVDVAHLANIATYLNTLAEGIANDLRPRVHEAHRLATIGGDGSRSALGANFPEVEDLAQREMGTHTAVDNSLKSFVEGLEKTATAVQKIAENYATTEQRNGLNAAVFTQALAG